MLLALSAQAQQSPTPLPATDPVPASAPQSPSPQQEVTTLGEVRAITPDEEEPVDLYRFKNPVQVQNNAFNRSWSEPPSLEQVGMSGGYVMMGINYAIAKTAQGLHRISGGPDQVQPAIARPPPQLSDEQRRRAEQFCGVKETCLEVSQD